MDQDERFSHIRTDPKFRPVRKFKPKTKIDKRFQSMFKDKKFKVNYTIDKRGRPIDHNSTKALKDFYNLSSEESDASDQEVDEETKPEVPKTEKSAPEGGNDSELTSKTDQNIPEEVKKKLRDLSVDYARGEEKLLSESSSDDDDSDDENIENKLNNQNEGIEHKWGELDNDAESTEEVTNRLAACNMNWDRIRAVDLMVLFNSFLPPGGLIKSVAIYPSEYGKKRMQEEETSGPSELVQNHDDDDKDENIEESEEGSKYHMEKLRQYQLNRLKYYYAVVTFDSATSANKIYSECDGMEYESSSTKVDLRFIPDDMTFADDDQKEICDRLPELNKYQPRFFTTSALQQAKVDLTWDETDPDRVELAQKLSGGKIDDINEAELHNYLAVDSSSEENDKSGGESDDNEENTLNPIEKYKLLLEEIEEKEKKKEEADVGMEVTWDMGVEEKAQEMVKEKMKENEDNTPFQKFLNKRKEKRKEKKNKAKTDESNDDDVTSSEETDEDQKPELELLLMNEVADDRKHFSLDGIQRGEKKKRNKKEKASDDADEFQIDVNDDRFSALFTSHLYNIDPTDPHFKKTKAMETLINEKFKRRNNVEAPYRDLSENKKNAELSVLVKSIKRKTKTIATNQSKRRR